MPLSIVAVAGIVRLLAAAWREPWHDEYYTLWISHRAFPDMLAALSLDSGPPLPYLLVKLLTLAGLPALAAGRLLSVAAGMLAVVLAYRAAASALGARPAVVLAGLLAFHPLALSFSSEGRAYGLLLLASAWAWERLEQLRYAGRGAPGLAGAVVLACWCHGLGPALAAAAAIAATTLPPRPRRQALGAVAAGLISILPWLPVAFRQPAAATTWMRDAWQALPPLERLAAPFRLIPPLAPFGQTLDLPTFPPVPSLFVGAMCLGLLLVARPPLRLVLLAAVPAAGLALLACLGAPAFYPGRAEALFLVPALALVAGGVASKPWQTGAGIAVVAAATVASVVTLAGWRSAAPSTEALLAQRIVSRYPGKAVVVASGHWWLDLSTALGRYGNSYQVLSYPGCVVTHPGWYDPVHCRAGTDERERLAARLALAEPAVAVIVAHGSRLAGELRPLVQRLGLEEALTLPGATLFLRPPP